ncbi:hypothetical protein BGX27_003410 [Mortierella sp. AM989]|nr:hypothetical protein BGX27_003410 [Mortierella sp. AM989]
MTTQVQQLMHQQLQQHIAPSFYDTQKSDHSQRGKRRKTLSLVAGSGDRGPHHQQQQMQQQSLHHPLVVRPPLPVTADALSTSANEQHFQSDRSSGPAQRIISWLRKKSIVKSASERPYFDPLGELRTTGPSFSFGPSNPSTSSGQPNSHGTMAITSNTNAVCVRGDGTTSGESNLKGGSMHGVLTNGNGTNNVAVVANTKQGSSGNTIISPLQALEEGRDPSLAALIQTLPLNWTDSKLKVHLGAVELSSLSSRHPAEIMFDIKKVVLRLGMEIKSDSDFKIKCVRRKRKISGSADLSASTATAPSAAGISAAGGLTSVGTLSVRSILQGHGLNRQPHNAGAAATPDDNASVLSSNVSVDRETWMNKRFGSGAGTGASARAGPSLGASVPGSASATGSTAANGKKRNGIRGLLWRNSTSIGLTSVQQNLPSAANTSIMGSTTTSSSGSSPGQSHPTPIPSRQLPQVMNGSALSQISATTGYGHVSTTAGKEAGGTTDSVATDVQDMDKGYSSSNSGSNVMMDGVLEQASSSQTPPPAIGGMSQSTTATTIGTATMPQQTRLHRQEPSDSSCTVAMGNGTIPERFILPTEPLYGEEAIDSGEEIRFSIELCRIKNLDGLYSVDIRRMRGNLWAYKFLYHAVLNTLDLQGKGGYLTGQPAQVQQILRGPASEIGTFAVSVQ